MASAKSCAAQLVEAIPQVMCQLRRQLLTTDSDLTVAQFRCLVMVQRIPDVSLGDLADATGVSPPAMSKLVDGLVESGHLTRKANGADRRRLQLALTAAGTRKVDQVGGALKNALAQQLAELPSGDLAALERGLARLNDSLQLVVAQ